MFNIEEFDIKLDTDFIGRNFIYCEEIDSTNTYLLSTKSQTIHGTVVLAESQTKGRGRRNREWLSISEQNLTFSILIKSPIDSAQLHFLNFGSALAVAQSIENLFQLNVELKWPNDVLVDGRKIAGILVESSSQGTKLEKIVIGFGINVNQTNFAGKFLIQPTSVKREFKQNCSRERILSEVLNNFETIFGMIKTEPEKILSNWKERCRLLGERIKIEDEGNIKYGIFDDIDENGFLLLKTENGKEKITVGDVSLLG
ncbi:MAG: biotin--[acetyl-CoA-carboxylase] ligase [bacterium]